MFTQKISNRILSYLCILAITSMKKRRQIQFRALFILLIYFCSNCLYVFFHHHSTHVVSYEHATPCEKANYYGQEEGTCHHKSHVSEASEKCDMCNNHTFSPHSLHTFFSESFLKVKVKRNTYASEYYYIQLPSVFTNRGPPSVSSPIV